MHLEKNIQCPKTKILMTTYIIDKRNPLNSPYLCMWMLIFTVGIIPILLFHVTFFWYRIFLDLKYPLLQLKFIHDRYHLSLRKQWDEGDNSRHFRGLVLPESRCLSSGTELILYVFKSSAKKNQKASQMLDCASAKPQEVASSKYTLEKKTFKALWKVSYRERFTIPLGFSFENKTHNVNTGKPCCF